MIKKLPFYHMRVDEYYTFGMQVVEVLRNHSTDEPRLNVLRTGISSALSKLNQAYLKPTNKGLTLSVKDADNKRDNCHKAFRSFVEACYLRGKKEWGNAPEILMDVLRLYGWTLYSDSYAKESSRLNQLFLDVDNNAILTEAIATIGATEWYNELKEAQVNFETVFANRNQANAALPDIKTEDALVELRQYFQVVFKYVESMSMMNVDTSYASLSKELNELIAPFRTAVAIREKEDAVRAEEL